MAKNELKKPSAPKITWHTAFREALQAELFAFRDSLEFLEEVPLTTEPLRIDVVVVKKKSDVQITKNIAAIFRSHNIVEYKSPSDHFSVDDFHKACSYVYLYMHLNKLEVSNVTLTIVAARRPRNLFQYLIRQGIPSSEQSPGIHAIQMGYFPVQIIESNQLPSEENIWLKSLRRDVNTQEMEKILQIKTNETNLRLQAYLYVLLLANPDIAKEMEADKMNQARLVQVLEDLGYIQEWKEQGIAIGEAKGVKQGEKRVLQQMPYVLKGLKNNVPAKQLAKETQLPLAEIKKIQSEL